MAVQSSPEIRAWMREHDVSSIAGLETYFEERVLALASAAGRSYIVWQVGHPSLLPIIFNSSSVLESRRCSYKCRSVHNIGEEA